MKIFLIKIKNYTIALYRHMLDSFRKVSDKEYNRRRNKCLGCPLRNKIDDTCSICHCDLTKKPRWKSEHCPKGKW